MSTIGLNIYPTVLGGKFGVVLTLPDLLASRPSVNIQTDLLICFCKFVTYYLGECTC